jgi:ABC-2 type transport system ATP-binding protein
MDGSEPVIEAEGLQKRYGDTAALDGLDLAVDAGTVCGIIGPNGAGKTTAVRTLATLLRADGGWARVAGYDVARQAVQVRARIGLVGQQTSVDEVLSGHQNLTMFGRLHHLPVAAARRRADELLDRFALGDTGRKPVAEYSGGMRRRLDLAASLIRAPRVLFLDEPTTGLDPAGRTEVWNAVRDLVASGTTLVLTTQYLEEVDQLADRVHVIDRGQVIAAGSPDELKARAGGDRIDVVVQDGDQLAVAAVAVAAAVGAEVEVVPEHRRISAPVTDRTAALTAVVTSLHDAGVAADDIALRRPSLDEVFIQLTGHLATAHRATGNPGPDPDPEPDSTRPDLAVPPAPSISDHQEMPA